MTIIIFLFPENLRLTVTSRDLQSLITERVLLLYITNCLVSGFIVLLPSFLVCHLFFEQQYVACMRTTVYRYRVIFVGQNIRGFRGWRSDHEYFTHE